MSFRVRDPITYSTDKVRIIELDNNLQPIGESTEVVFFHDEHSGNAVQDPRFININQL